MGEYDKELVPTPMDRLEREYPSWAVSMPRLRVKAARVLMQANSLQYCDPTTDLGIRLRSQAVKVLQRLEDEGPHPVYDQLVSEFNYDPLGAANFRNRYVMGAPQGRMTVPTPPLSFVDKRGRIT